jgi:hypothetical protein
MAYDLTRRRLLVNTVALASVAGVPSGLTAAAPSAPWYRRALRWGQTNITEKDPARYDIPWWREYWKRTEVQGVIINAGGIVAYYPSKFPLHYRAEFLGDRDLFGELTAAAHQDGIMVLARMDSNRASAQFYEAHPDWFARDSSGRPYRAADRYVTCIFSAYYDEYLPDVLREIIGRSKPEGVTDNSWAGLGRDSICYCANCERQFRGRAGKLLPRRKNWDDPVYRDWILWNYQRRVEVWELNNRVTRAAGGPDCVWAGMNSGSISGQARSFRDLREICRRAAIILLDHQNRSDSAGFQQNTDTGKLVHGVLGWEKLAPESMAMYQGGRNAFRLSAKPAAEACHWMLAGFAGGIQPWWHHIGAYHEDRRAYRTAEPVMKWHKANEAFLVDRRPVANVGVAWSQRNTDFYGRDEAEDLTESPYRGVMQALVRARIPYVPVHIDDLEREAPGLSLLVLPNLGAMSEAQCGAVRRFVARGGALLATGAASLYDEWGDPRADYGLADVFGAHAEGRSLSAAEKTAATGAAHTYLRLAPEWRAKVWGPKAGDEPAPAGQRHPVLRGFEETDILPFGGRLERIKVDPGAAVPLTYIPPFPIYPPETAWMREPKTDVAGLVLRERGSSRIAFLPADLDRRYARDNLPDHGNLLANIMRWACRDEFPFTVEGPGLVSCDLYEQPGRLILHILNLTSTAAWRAPMEELVPVGPFRIRIRPRPGVRGASVDLRVARQPARVTSTGGSVAFEIPLIHDHELGIIT